MTYQSRSSRIKSLARNDDSIYWSTIDSFSNMTDATRSSSRRSSIRTHSRNYIDPWDLENYAYIQRSMESDVSPNSAHHDDMSSPYYMENGKIEDCPCYAGLDEQLFYNAKYEMIPDSFTDMDEMSSNSCSGSTVSTIQYRSMPHIHFPPPPMQPSSAYECYANVIIPKRRVPFDNMAPANVIPLHAYHPTPNQISNEILSDAYQQQQQQQQQLQQQQHTIEYPQPEHYYDQFNDGGYLPHESHQRRQSVSLPCYECIDMQQTTPLYYGGRENYENLYEQRKQHLERFGLSKKGLLQIDYSLSWMNLQRIISNK